VSYRIEITAASLEELADKALALGGRLIVVHTASAPAQIRAEVAEAAPAPKPQAPSIKSSTPVESTSNGQPSDQNASEEASSSDLASPPKDDVPDFDTVVTPLVLKLVEVKGKPAAQEVLGRFGVVKASQLSSERWQELVNAINDELAA
jgi:hypothetical protein